MLRGNEERGFPRSLVGRDEEQILCPVLASPRNTPQNTPLPPLNRPLPLPQALGALHPHPCFQKGGGSCTMRTHCPATPPVRAWVGVLRPRTIPASTRLSPKTFLAMCKWDVPSARQEKPWRGFQARPSSIPSFPRQGVEKKDGKRE